MKHSSKGILPKKWDIVIGILVLCTLLACWGRKNAADGVKVRIIQDNEVLYEIDLSAVTDTYLITPVSGVTIEVSPDGVGFVASDCVTQDCVKAGKCRKAGDMAMCLPHKTMIVVIGEKQASSPDVITY